MGSNAPWDNDGVSDDLESQVTASSSGSSVSRKSSKRWHRETGAGHRRVPVEMNVSDAVVKQIRQDYGFDPILAPSQEFHSHPHLAIQRNRLEIRALKEIAHLHGDPMIWDVGSGARRHAKHRIHCLCPYMQPGDAARHTLATKNGNSVCTHRLQECDCGTADVLLFVHSAYYFSLEELVKQIDKSKLGEAYVVGHLFQEAYGALSYEEGSYRFDLTSRDDWVITKVRGNAHEYRHPPLLWDGRIPTTTDGKTLHVEQIVQMGDTYLWRVRVVQQTQIQEPPVMWQHALVDYKHMGPIYVPGNDSVTKQSLAANGQVEVQIDQLVGRYGWLWTYTTNGRVYIPRGLVEEVASKVVRQKRDPALMMDVVYKFKAALASSRLPAGARLDAITIGSALAFNLNVKNEIDTSHTIVSRYSEDWKLHTYLHTLSPIRATAWWMILVWAFLTALWAGGWFTFDAEVQLPYHLSLAIALLLTLPVFCLFCCSVGSFCTARYHSRRTADNWSRTLYTEAHTSHIVGDVISPTITRFPAYPNLREPLLPPGCGDIVIGPDPRPPRHPGRLATPLTLDGIGVSEVVPTIPRTDQEAEITAITLRMLTPPTEVKQNAYDKFIALGGKAAKMLLAIRVTGYDTMHDEWMNQSKFPKHVREKFLRAWQKCNLGNSIPNRGMFNAFVKLEKMKAVAMDLIEGLKTRLINGPPDAVKVAVGPWTAQLYYKLLSAWDGIKCPILYASGKTPDEIGSVIDRFVGECGGWSDVIGIWDDCSMYDSTLENELLKVRDIVYPAVGFPKETMAWLHSVSPKGATPHGVSYDLGEKIVRVWTEQPMLVPMMKLRSGEMDTNLIGTMINALAHESGLPPHVKYLMLVCGDDNLILMRKTDFTHEIANNLRQHLEDLGLKPTQGISDRRCDWEFCSKLLWSGIDRKTNRECTVLGPKPARWLHRVGWMVNGPLEPNFREVVLSSYQDVHHIPLLREYVTKGMEVSMHQKRSGRIWSEMKHVSRMFDCAAINFTMLAERYNITTAHYEQFCARINQVVAPRTVISLPWLDVAAKRDEE